VIFFVLDLDNPDPDKPARGKTGRKAIDLDAPAEETAARAKKEGSKLEILRDDTATYRKRRAAVDPVKQKRQRVVLTSFLVIVIVASMAFAAIYFLNRTPTFEQARDAPLPVTSAPTHVASPAANRSRTAAPVVPNRRPNPLSTMPGLTQNEERFKDSTSGGIH
jgi:hypothetical protein